MAHTETPLMRQYLDVKSRHSDSLLFFRLGDFYELFLDDAKVAASILDIALTTRNKNDPNPIPMCGVPYHSSTQYIYKLIQAGHKVAICEQLEDPASVKGIVKRDVVRVITPGTVLDLEALDSKIPNYIHAVTLHPKGSLFWATCEFTTGHFWFGKFKNIEEWLLYTQSHHFTEMIFPDTHLGESLLTKINSYRVNQCLAQTVPSFYFDQDYAQTRLCEQFHTTHIEAIHPNLKESTQACGALIKYLQESQKSQFLPNFTKLEEWGCSDVMQLDPATISALELLPQSNRLHSSHANDVSLLSWIDRTKTAMGARLLRHWILRPLINIDKIQNRYNEVTSILSEYEIIQKILSDVYDIERLNTRISFSGNSSSLANARDLKSLSLSILKLNDLLVLLNQKKLKLLSAHLEQCLASSLVQLATKTQQALIDQPPISVRAGGLFNKGYSAPLDELIDLSSNGEQWIANYEAEQRKTSGISSLKVKYNRVFGYFIEITKSNLDSVPSHYIRKQTMSNGERYITEELKNFEEKILSSEKKRHDLEFLLFQELCKEFLNFSSQLSEIAKETAHIDIIAAFAQLACNEQYTMPCLNQSEELYIEGGIHPTVSPAMPTEQCFVPNSVSMNHKNRFLMITGPNMGGKSTVMRQTALITLLAQIGSFVPAQKAKIGIVDRIFTRIGAHDNIANGASTFMVEMNEMSYILRNATSKSLILIDEIGRGTSTFDGMSLAWALAEEIAFRIQARTLFATHYHELTQLAEENLSIQNLRMGVTIGEDPAGKPIVQFLYRLEPGAAERSYGILVARLAGLSEKVLTRAERILAELESQPHQKPEKIVIRKPKKTPQMDLFI